jgi:hypothetical protein
MDMSSEVPPLRVSTGEAGTHGMDRCPRDANPLEHPLEVGPASRRPGRWDRA